MGTSKGTKRAIAWSLILAAIILHNDWWLWSSSKIIVWNWLPLPAFYHLLLNSVVAFFILLLFTRWAMPGKLPADILFAGKPDASAGAGIKEQPIATGTVVAGKEGER